MSSPRSGNVQLPPSDTEMQLLLSEAQPVAPENKVEEASAPAPALPAHEVAIAINEPHYPALELHGTFAPARTRSRYSGLAINAALVLGWLYTDTAKPFATDSLNQNVSAFLLLSSLIWSIANICSTEPEQDQEATFALNLQPRR